MPRLNGYGGSGDVHVGQDKDMPCFGRAAGVEVHVVRWTEPKTEPESLFSNSAPVPRRRFRS